MPPLFPPAYPDRPDAPLCAFGPSFSEDLSRSVILTVWDPDTPSDEALDIRVAASLTMLEGFHPRDHVECLLAAQGVGFHVALMDNLALASRSDTPLAMVIKLRSGAVQLGRAFSVTLTTLDRRQSKPLPERPPAAEPPAPAAPRSGPCSPSEQPAPEEEAAEDDPRPEDIETRPDGTPGSLAAYLPKRPQTVFVPEEPLIMRALATRPKPWRMVNAPERDPAPPPEPPQSSFPPSGPISSRGPLHLTGKVQGGDALARFAAARFDPDAPFDVPNFDDEDSVVELELISTGNDPEGDAERQALIDAHPEGKPIVTYRYGSKAPPDD